MEKGCIFIVEMDNGDIIAARKDEIEHEIKHVEERGGELKFKTIGKIKEPPQGLSPDFQSRLIEFYEKDREITKELMDKSVIAIVNLIMGL